MSNARVNDSWMSFWSSPSFTLVKDGRDMTLEIQARRDVEGDFVNDAGK